MIVNFFLKPFKDIKFPDVKFLVDNKIQESYDLDYKKDNIDNKKLSKLMIAFANASGGYIVFGIEEEKVNNKNTGIPNKIIGVDKGDFSTKVTQIALAHTQPKIMPLVRVVELEGNSDKVIVIIKINEAIEPIMYYHANDKDSNKFFIRINDKIEPADQNLLKKLYSKRPFFRELEFQVAELDRNQIEEFNIYLDPAVRGNYISVGFGIFPYNNNLTVIDPNDRATELFIKDLYQYLSHRSPSGVIKDFYKFINDFNYMGTLFKSKFKYNSENVFNSTEIEIFSNGNIDGNIIFQTRSAKEIADRTHKEINESREKDYQYSPFLYHEIVPYLLIMLLRLATLVYGERFSGRFKFTFRILSSSNISLDINEYLAMSHTTDIKIEKEIYCVDLAQGENFKERLSEILKEFLRYFGYELQNVDKGYSIFEDFINKYLKTFFKSN